MDAPVSVRHVFYRCTDPRLPEAVDKTEHGYKQVQRRIVHMRRAGLIPYGSITYNLENLKTLCRSCHIEQHRRQLTPGEAAWRALVDDLVRLG